MEDSPPKKSLLERTNSWKPFIDEVSGAVLAHDYRKETIEKILHIIDPDLSMWPGSFGNYAKGIVIGSGFASGRTYLYKIPFQLFLSKNRSVFTNAPFQAIQEFNRLVDALFPKPVAETLTINENVARRYLSQTEQILAKGEQASENIIRRLKAHKDQIRTKELPTRITVQNDAGPLPKEQNISQKHPSPFSQRSPLNKETQDLIEGILSTHPSTEHDRQVIALLEQGVEKSSLRRQNFFITLTSPKFFTFKDLVDRAKEIPPISFDRAFLTKVFALADLEKIAPLINKKNETSSSTYASILEVAERRSETIRRIQKGVEHFAALIQPFVVREETRAQAQLLINQLSTIDFPESLFKEGRDVEETITRKEELFKTVSERIEAEFRDLINKQREISRSAETTNMLLYAARWEMVSGAVPYPDLASSSAQVCNHLLGSLNADRERLATGVISLFQYTLDIVQSIYEPDVRLIRGELTARSLRLKDLREAVRSQLSTIDRHLALLSLSGITNDKMFTERKWIAELLYKLLAPYSLFQYTYGPESINILFRYWWQDFERYAREDSKRRSSVIHSIKDGTQGLIRSIARTIDLVERTSPNGRQRLYQRFIEVTKEGQPSILDQWLEDESTTIVGYFVPHLALIPQAEQKPLIERLLQVEQHMREISQFAKDLKAIKTFEPERIDSILEVLSIFPCLPSLDQLPPIRIQDQLFRMEQALRMVDEELIIELGLLDKKARVDAGYAINNLIPLAVLKAAPILNSLTEQLHELQRNTDPYIASIAHFLLEDASQLSQALESVEFDQELFFATFQKLTVLLFTRKLLVNAPKPQSFAGILLIPTATSQIVRRFRQMEGQGEFSLSSSIIDSLDSIASGAWNISSPQSINSKEVASKLSTFIILAKRIITTSGLSERREARFIEGLEKIHKELSEEPRFDISRFSFVPGDLEYFWPTTP